MTLGNMRAQRRALARGVCWRDADHVTQVTLTYLPSVLPNIPVLSRLII
jgi:hypothetical protein